MAFYDVDNATLKAENPPPPGTSPTVSESRTVDSLTEGSVRQGASIREVTSALSDLATLVQESLRQVAERQTLGQESSSRALAEVAETSRSLHDELRGLAARVAVMQEQLEAMQSTNSASQVVNERRIRQTVWVGATGIAVILVLLVVLLVRG